jgi:hypothetical protein
MTYVWIVKQDGKELGTVEAITRKGACHEAYEKFGIEQPKRNSISVDKTERRFIIAIDPAAPGGEGVAYTEVSRNALGDVVCSFNPALAGPDSGRTLEDCRMRFDMPPFVPFPDWKKK